MITVASETKDSIDESAICWLESFAHLVARMLESANANDAARKCIYESLVNRKTRSVAVLADVLCAWARTATEADMVHLVTYDATTDVCRPRGVSLSDEVLERLARDYFKDPSKLKPDVARKFIRPFLLPLRRGKSWEVFTTAQPRAYWPVRAEIKKTIMQDLFEAAVAMPFSIDPTAQPDGVLWFCWAEREKLQKVIDDPELVARMDAPNGASDEALRKDVKKRMVEGVSNCIGAVSRVAAGQYGIFRAAHQLAEPP